MGIVVPRAHHKCPPQFRRLYPPQHRMQRPACGEAEVNFISRYCGPHIAERIQPPRLMVSQSIVPKTSLPAYSFFVSSVTAQTWNLECKPICRTFPDLSATVGTDGGFPLPTRLCRDSLGHYLSTKRNGRRPRPLSSHKNTLCISTPIQTLRTPPSAGAILWPHVRGQAYIFAQPL